MHDIYFVCQILTKNHLNYPNACRKCPGASIIYQGKKKVAGPSTTSPRACNQSQTIQLYKISSIYLRGGKDNGVLVGWGNIPCRIYLFGYSDPRRSIRAMLMGADMLDKSGPNKRRTKTEHILKGGLSAKHSLRFITSQ
jgi:hypothetical protein